MKAHEAWYKEYTARVEPQIDYLDTQVSWQAALEWFYDKLDYSIEHKELKDIIEEELEDKNVQGRDRWCEKCKAKIEAAEDMDVIAICKPCAERKRR